MLSLMGLSGVSIFFIVIAVVIVILLGIYIGMIPLNVYIKAFLSGAYIPGFKLIGMKLRHVDASMLVDAYINAKKAGVDVSMQDLESHYLAGGDVEKVVDALITAQGAKIDLTVGTAKAIDLANRDILKAVQNCVRPIVITTPEILALPQNGIEVKIKAKITVRSDIENLIGGASEDTIIARVGEAIVTMVGSSKTHQEVLENPDRISNEISKKNLDKGTAFKILSVEISSIEVGRNIGAKLLAERAETDVQIANAKAEERRAMAKAQEQEMRAKTQEMKARLLSAEAEVPRAISVAFKEGQIGVMDYYRMQNMIADTTLRNSLGGKGGNKNNESI